MLQLTAKLGKVVKNGVGYLNTDGQKVSGPTMSPSN